MTPHLRVTVESLLERSADGWGHHFDEVDVPVLELSFRYGDVTLDATDPRERFFVSRGGALRSVARDLEAELGARRILESFGAIRARLPRRRRARPRLTRQLPGASGGRRARLLLVQRLRLAAAAPVALAGRGGARLPVLGDRRRCAVVCGRRLQHAGLVCARARRGRRGPAHEHPAGAARPARALSRRHVVARALASAAALLCAADRRRALPAGVGRAAARGVARAARAVRRHQLQARSAALPDDARGGLDAPRVAGAPLARRRSHPVSRPRVGGRHANCGGAARAARRTCGPTSARAWRGCSTCARRDAGGVLADDMGLGKTLQTIAHLCAEKRRRAQRAARRWSSRRRAWSATGQREIARFAPRAARCSCSHGAERRQRARRRSTRADVVITSYPLLVRDMAMLCDARSSTCSCSTRRRRSRTAAARRTEPSRELTARARLCSPARRSRTTCDELWSLFDFVMPGLLGDERRLPRRFSHPDRADGDDEPPRRAARSRRAVHAAPHEGEVAPELPPKTEIVRAGRARAASSASSTRASASPPTPRCAG